jgi:GNAT superfamily N-acetyltransferase
MRVTCRTRQPGRPSVCLTCRPVLRHLKKGDTLTENIPPALAERSEAEAMYHFETGAPPHVLAALGIETLRVGGGVVLSMREDTTSFWSKALGFGFDEPVTADLIAEICGFYRSQRTPMATIQLAPSVLPDDWDEICAKENLSPGSLLVKLGGSVDAAVARLEENEGPLRAERVEAGQAAEWARVVLSVFGMPEGPMSEMCSAAVSARGWHPYGVWDGDELIAAATMHVNGDTAQFFAGATVPHARRRGAQSALLAARARAAHAAGCRWLIGETGAEAPGEHNPSLHNMLRTGLTVLYERRDWIWRLNG